MLRSVIFEKADNNPGPSDAGPSNTSTSIADKGMLHVCWYKPRLKHNVD